MTQTQPEGLVQYKAKVNLPGGISKGDNIDYHPVQKKYIHTKTNTALMWDCDKETKFFTRLVPPKYKIRNFVCIKVAASFLKVRSFGNYDKNKGTSFHIPAFTELQIVGLEGADYIVRLGPNSPAVKIAEKLLQKCQFWYFYNSDGILSRVFLGKELKKEIFCKSIGNYFTTKEEGAAWLKKVAKYKIA